MNVKTGDKLYIRPIALKITMSDVTFKFTYFSRFCAICWWAYEGLNGQADFLF